MSSTKTRNRIQPDPGFHLPLETRIRGMMEFFGTNPEWGEGWDTRTFQEVTFISVDKQNQSVEFELNIAPFLCNKTGNLHGGCAATIMDMLTSMALATVSKPGFLDKGHVSRTITMSYLRPVPMGVKTRISCRIVAAGRNLANLSGEIRSPDGKVLVTCIHDKAVFSSGETKL